MLFKRGDTFYGSLNILSSGSIKLPIVFSSYGDGPDAIITGLSEIIGWTRINDSLWESASSLTSRDRINLLLLNDKSLSVGRYPNKNAKNQGFLTFTNHVQNRSIQSSQLKKKIDWTGGDIIIRKERWFFERCPIIKQLGSTIYYTSQTEYEPLDGYGFFIQNHLATLDQDGEWCFDRKTHKISIRYSQEINQKKILVSTIDNLITLRNVSHIRLINLILRGSNLNLLDIGKCSRIEISNCRFLLAGKDAIYGYGIDGFSLTDSEINQSNNNGIYLAYNCSNSIISNNIIKNIGLDAGKVDASNYNTFTAIALGGTGRNSNSTATIKQNIIDSIGYNGISFNGSDINIDNNVISNFCLTKDDGGGIYTNVGKKQEHVYYRRIVSGNIIFAGGTALSGTANPSVTSTWGIYLDDNSHNVNVKDNTVTNMPNSGIFLHNAHEIQLTNNILFSNQKEQLRMSNDGAAKVANVSMKRNVLVAENESQLLIYFTAPIREIKFFGNADSNYYMMPAAIMNQNIRTNDSYNSVKSWKYFTGQDRASKIIPFRKNHQYKVLLLTNPTARMKSISSFPRYFDLNGKIRNGPFMIPAYHSIVLRVPVK